MKNFLTGWKYGISIALGSYYKVPGTELFKSNKTSITILAALLTISFLVNAGVLYFLLTGGWKTSGIPAKKEEIKVQEPERKTRGIMMLIEYKDTVGLVNFVNDLHSRGIYSLLSASPDFVEENCETIKKLLDYGMEIVSQNPGGSFWNVPYEEQYEAVKDAKERIEACTGKPLRVVSSRYFASDENTVKAAEALGIPYVTARGTTGTEATVFKPEEYNVRIISVSNIPSIKWKYGSLCDYSYWVREGSPEDMEEELVAGLENKKITPVSHTNIGGQKAQWNEMWLHFFDRKAIEWQSLDEFASVDLTLPTWQIPRNKNAPYTPQERPLIPYDEEENVDNPCAIGDLSGGNSNSTDSVETTAGKILMFHNGRGPMCLEAVKFLESLGFPSEQVLDSDEDFYERLNSLKSKFDISEGKSETFSYYPIIFINDRAFSGFDDAVIAALLEEVAKTGR